MSRMLWFGLGAIAGAAYASRIINTERLDLAVGETRPATQAKNMLNDYKGQMRDYKTQLADMVEQQSDRIGELISDRGHMMAEQIRGITFLEESGTESIGEGTPHSTTTTSTTQSSPVVGGRTGEQPL